MHAPPVLEEEYLRTGEEEEDERRRRRKVQDQWQELVGVERVH